MWYVYDHQGLHLSLIYFDVELLIRLGGPQKKKCDFNPTNESPLLLLLLSRFSRVWLCATPQTGAQANSDIRTCLQLSWPIKLRASGCFGHTWKVSPSELLPCTIASSRICVLFPANRIWQKLKACHSLDWLYYIEDSISADWRRSCSR